MRSVPPLSALIVCLCLGSLHCAELTRVEPSIVSSKGGTQVTFTGKGFAERTHVARINQIPLDQQVVGSLGTSIRGLSPALPVGTYDADIYNTRTRTVEDILRRVVQVRAPSPTVTRVDPCWLWTCRLTRIKIEGENFTPSTSVVFLEHGTTNRIVLQDVQFVSSTLIRAATPLHAAGKVDAQANDAGILTLLENAAEYFAPTTNEVPGPQQMEMSIAADDSGRRTARFSWYNVVPYDSIVVTDAETGKVVTELSGKATFLELDAVGLEQMELEFEGVRAGRRSRIAMARAARYECKTPPLLNLEGTPGTKNFYLRGDHWENQVDRCSAGGGGGAALLKLIAGQNAFYQDPGTLGFVASERELSARGIADFFKEWNKAVTGLEIPQPADKLEFAVLVDKLGAAFGLQMRGHLIHVHPDDGFEDEFTFPDLRAGVGQTWNSVIYYRADKDVADPTAVPCQLQIPEGTYALEIYAVGGDPKLPYFLIPDSGRPDELFIPGVPCPPYPAVKVSDYTGIRTLPVISGVSAVAVEPLPPEGALDQLTVKFSASGKWYDEEWGEHSIQPGDPTYINSQHVEYTWVVQDRAGAVKSTGKSSGNSVFIPGIRDWGCYDLDITLLDKACGFTKTQYFEVPVLPDPLPQCAGKVILFTKVSPDPGGIYGIVGLDPPPGTGSFEGKRPIKLKVLVVPECACGLSPDESTFDNCPAARINSTTPENWKVNDESDDFLFQLTAVYTVNHVPIYFDLGATIWVADLCPSVTKGPKYYSVKIDDLGAVPAHAALTGTTFKVVRLRAKALKQYSAATGGFIPVVNAPWQNVGSNMWLTNRPEVLTDSYWTGNFDSSDESYHFLVKSSEDTEANAPAGASEEVELMGGAKLESKNSNVSSGFTSRMYTVGGIWYPDTSPGTASGNVMSSAMQSSPLQVAPQPVQGGGGSTDGEGASSLTRFEWCDNSTIFENHFETTLFDAILYSGVIGPVPVTIWASIGFGLDIALESQLTVLLAPFAALEGGNYIETHFYLLFGIDLSIPCSIRADVLGGVASLSIGLTPEVEFDLDTHISLINTDLAVRMYLSCVFNLYMNFEACLFWFLCIGWEFPLVEDLDLIPPVGCDPYPLVTCDYDGPGGDMSCAPLWGTGGGAEAAGPATVTRSARGRGADGVPLPPSYQVVSAPAIAVSPDRQNIITCSFDSTGYGHVAINEHELPGSNIIGQYMDPAAAFLSNDVAVLAYSQKFCSEAPHPEYCELEELTTAQTNELMNQQEIVFEVYQGSGFNWARTGVFRASDDVAPQAQRRVDGICSVAASWDGQVMQDGGEAIVAWVRYESAQHLVSDPTPTRIYVKDFKQASGVWKFRAEDVPTVRPKMEETAIYTRKISSTGLLAPMVKISEPGINIEPRIAYSPAGDLAYCVWVHDPTHKDLLSSNRGRFLRYSVYARDTDSWSPPQDAVAAPNDYPGILEPYIALKVTSLGELEGLLAFTALDYNASEKDSGLSGGSRYVYASILEDGVFGTPVRIHGKCMKQEYGHWVTGVMEIPDLVDPTDQLHWKNPEWVMIWQGTGAMGLPAGSGNAMVSVLGSKGGEWAAPINLTPDKNIHTNVVGALAGGFLHTVHVDCGPALAGMGGGAQERTRTIQRKATRLEPDLAVVGCKISDPFPYPGSRVKAKVRIENRGLAGVPFHASGDSAAALQLVYITDAGRERRVGLRTMPDIPPGEMREFEMEIEMPHEPLRLVARMDPNPIDRDRTNDSLEVLFGAPTPRDLQCESVYQSNEAMTIAVTLSWTNPLPYNEITVYRDGLVVATLPGTSRRLVDEYVAVGEHTYGVRGRVGASRSAKATCTLVHQTPVVQPQFKRGDADGDTSNVINITDPVFTLNYLFLGTRAPPCPDAADSNDDGRVDISDAVWTLGWLFLGGPRPRSPGPTYCGVDPTSDELGPCSYTCQ